MVDRTAAQYRPLSDDRPDALGQRHDTISGCENSALGGFGKSVRNSTFAPVFGIDILLGHQSSQIEDHLDAETSLERQGNGRWNMTARMDHLDPVAPHQGARFANSGKHVVD